MSNFNDDPGFLDYMRQIDVLRSRPRLLALQKSEEQKLYDSMKASDACVKEVDHDHKVRIHVQAVSKGVFRIFTRFVENFRIEGLYICFACVRNYLELE